MRLYDYGLGTLSQYDLTAERSARTRGAAALLYRAGTFETERVSRFGEKAEETAGTVATSAGKRYQYGLFPGEYAGQPCQPG